MGDLTFDHGDRYFYLGRRGERVEILCLTYLEGNPRLPGDVFYHDPRVCMGAIGFEIVEDVPWREEPMALQGEGGEVLGTLRVRLLGTAQAGRAAGWLFKGVWWPQPRVLPVPAETSVRARAVQALSRSPLPPAIIAIASVQGADRRETAEKIYQEAVLSRLVSRSNFDGRQGTAAIHP